MWLVGFIGCSVCSQGSLGLPHVCVCVYTFESLKVVPLYKLMTRPLHGMIQYGMIWYGMVWVGFERVYERENKQRHLQASRAREKEVDWTWPGMSVREGRRIAGDRE